MSSNNPTPNPDLAAILATLARLNANGSFPTQPAAAIQAPPERPQHIHSVQPQGQPHIPQSWPPAVSAPRVQPKSAPRFDPSTIVEWTTARDCVMKMASLNSQMQKEIRQLIKAQHDHEIQWWRSRQELIKQQSFRVDGQKKIDDMLKGLGGSVSESKSKTSPEDLVAEIKTFDEKVHRAQMQMVEEMTRKFKNLGIPFFGTNPSLVIPIGKGEVVEGDGGIKLKGGMLHQTDLVALQKRMLVFLEEMHSDH